MSTPEASPLGSQEPLDEVGKGYWLVLADEWSRVVEELEPCIGKQDGQPMCVLPGEEPASLARPYDEGGLIERTQSVRR
jgi:hypothetical protein